MAEAASLLLLRKKAQAIYGDQEDHSDCKLAVELIEEANQGQWV